MDVYFFYYIKILLIYNFETYEKYKNYNILIWERFSIFLIYVINFNNYLLNYLLVKLDWYMIENFL